jgi:hypothetical protein
MTPEMLLPFLMPRDTAGASARDDDDRDDDDREDDDRDDDDREDDDAEDDDAFEALFERRRGKYKARTPRPYQSPSARGGRATVQTGQGELPVQLENVVPADEFRNVSESIRKDIGDTRTAIQNAEQRAIREEAAIQKQVVTLKKNAKKTTKRLSKTEKASAKLKKEVENVRMMSMLMMLMQKPPQIERIDGVKLEGGILQPSDSDKTPATTYKTDSTSTMLPLMMMMGGGEGGDNGMMMAFMMMALVK